MANERIIDIPDGKTVKFVRNGLEIVFGNPDGGHPELAESVGLTTEDLFRQQKVDGGLVLVYKTKKMLTVNGRSGSFDWPPDEMPEIRQETIRRLKELFPEWDIS